MSSKSQKQLAYINSFQFHEDPDVNPQNLFSNIHIYKRNEVNQCMLPRELDILPYNFVISHLDITPYREREQIN